jgi:hypothetical protein
MIGYNTIQLIRGYGLVILRPRSTEYEDLQQRNKWFTIL